MSTPLGYYVLAEDLVMLEQIASRLCAGSDKMRDEGNLLWVLIWRMKEFPVMGGEQ